MNSLAEVQYAVRFETENHRRDLQAAREQDRRAWWIAAASGSRGAGIRQVAVRLGDLIAELRCQVESRLASEPAATAC